MVDESDSMKMDKRNLNKIPWKGPLPDIFQSIANSLNFTYSLANSRDGHYGMLVDGQWSGIIKDLMDEVADVSVANLMVTDVRATYVDYSIPVIDEKMSFFINKEISTQYMLFLQPFTWQVWVVLGLLIFLTSILFYIIIRISQDEKADEFALLQCFTFVFGSLCGFGVRRWSTTTETVHGR